MKKQASLKVEEKCRHTEPLSVAHPETGTQYTFWKSGVPAPHSERKGLQGHRDLKEGLRVGGYLQSNGDFIY